MAEEGFVIQIDSFKTDNGIGVYTGNAEPVTLGPVFVDGINGSDANRGLAPNDALRTIAGLQRKFGQLATNGARITVKFAGVGGFDEDATANLEYKAMTLYTGSAESIESSFLYEGPDMVPFTPSTGPSVTTLDAGNPSDRVDQSGAVSATGRRTRLNATGAPGWTVNDFQVSEAFLRITRAGVLVAPEIPIAENDASSVVVDNADFDGFVLAGDTIEIVERGATIVGDASQFEFLNILGFGSGFVGLIDLTTQKVFTRLGFRALTLSGVPSVGFDRCTFEAVFGLSVFSNGGVPLMTNCKSLGQVVLQAPAQGLQVTDPSGTFLNGGAASQCLMVVGSRLNIIGGTVFAGRGISVWADTTGPDGGILAQGRAFVTLDVFAGLGGFTGINPGGAVIGGLSAVEDSVIQFRGGDVTEIEAGGADCSISSGATVSYGTGAGEIQEPAPGFDGIFTERLDVNAGSNPTTDTSMVRAL